MSDTPLILTLALDTEAEVFFDRLRQQHFPPERNFLKAHLTLFHHLPPQEPRVVAAIEAASRQPPFPLAVTGVVLIGRGVAFRLESAVLLQLHRGLQQQWLPWLLPQDKQKLWPHVTVQNKVAPQAARALHQQLQSTFTPFEVQATGLRLWRYLGGPWEPVNTYWFERV
jgi:2'-5' RNA ligase